MPPDEQPQEGQGTDGQGGSPYDSYLQSVPDGAKEAAEAWFKDTSKGLDAKLQEAAEIQKRWEPYQETLDPQRYPPEQLSELLAWHQQVTSSDEAFKEWLGVAAKEAGITPEEARQDILEDAEVHGELSKEEVQQLVQQQLAEQTAPLQERFETLEQEKAIDFEDGAIKTELGRLEKEHGLELSEEMRKQVLDLGLPHAVNERGEELPVGDVSWVLKGLDSLKKIHTEGQKLFVNEKITMPGAPITGGSQERSTQPTDMKQVEAQAKERMRQMMQSNP